ncbi:HlyU family transcriptional regulator [Mesorhizobium sp. BAC0120]|uniref:HlyU family transcriptional regulator n=1 Tax=Mesorhizobium sp. BAC0120 TaxID=3090670 RepID=UPI00298D5C4D|nr:HlyU family transcriptional regulator [Mesorhizobium sp. BAC0120]MDW6022440.1 HlyU family transcriptional regulator [Mesorhizobium sp. BAC0120]
MSFLRRLFGSSSGGETAASSVAVAKEIEHKGFLIQATPYKAEGGQYQTCGVVSKEIDGVMKEHRFIRADRFAALDDAVDISLKKGQQLVDEQGDRIFN